MQFLSAVRNFRNANPDATSISEVHHAPREVKGGDSVYETLAFFRKGHSPKKIAELRALATSTVNGHIASLIQSGHIESIDMLVEPAKHAPIRAAFKKHGYATLGTVKEHLGDNFSYDELRFVRALDERGK
jgi:ATP-dependent DNA helicase RecQ